MFHVKRFRRESAVIRRFGANRPYNAFMESTEALVAATPSRTLGGFVEVPCIHSCQLQGGIPLIDLHFRRFENIVGGHHLRSGTRFLIKFQRNSWGNRTLGKVASWSHPKGCVKP